MIHQCGEHMYMKFRFGIANSLSVGLTDDLTVNEFFITRNLYVLLNKMLSRYST